MDKVTELRSYLARLFTIFLKILGAKPVLYDQNRVHHWQYTVTVFRTRGRPLQDTISLVNTRQIFGNLQSSGTRTITMKLRV